MRVLIIGGGGFVGAKLGAALAGAGALRGREISELRLADLAAPTPPAGATASALDIADKAAVDALFAEGWDAIFHLAAVVSGQAEQDVDLGYRVNLHGSLNVLEAARASAAARGAPPVLVFTSSIAVYGGPAPEPLGDWTLHNPQTSYGAQKAMVELAVTDYSRKGFIDGRGLRLPTVSVRGGAANKAASSFMSSIFREPLQGETANCPVGPDFAHWYSAPRTVVANLVHAAELAADAFGTNRCLALPGMTLTIGEGVEAMRRVAGDAVVERISWEREPEIERIVMGWKARIDDSRAVSLGFRKDVSFEDNIRWFLEDDIRR